MSRVVTVESVDTNAGYAYCTSNKMDRTTRISLAILTKRFTLFA